MEKLRKFAIWIPGVIAATLVAATQVGPVEAQSKLSEWAAFFGIVAPSVWLSDVHVLWGALVGAALFYGWLFIPRGNAPAVAAVSQPDLPLFHALDYLVNDSVAVLKQNPPPAVERFGPAKDQLVVFRGKPQQDALVKLEEQLAYGTLAAFGRTADAPGAEPTRFDERISAIPTEYWKEAKLHPIYARISSDALAHTVARGFGYQKLYLYADVRLNRKQVESFWKRRAWWRRAWMRIRGQRIGDYLADDPGTREVEVVATKNGWDNIRLRHPGDRWTRTLRAGQGLPSWQEFADDYDENARRGRYFRVAACSEQETAFLRVFTTAELPMRAGEWSTFLLNTVYRAGEQLAHDGVLERANVGEAIVRYSVPDLTAEVWDTAGMREKLVKRSVDVDLNLVQGTLASGGGAHGSH